MVKYVEKVVIKKDTQKLVHFLTQVEEIKSKIIFKNIIKAWCLFLSL